MTSETVGLHIFLGKGTERPTPAPPGLVAAFQSASVQSSPRGRTGFQLGLRAGSLREANALLERFQAGLEHESRVVLAVRIRGALAVLSDGIITQHQVSVTQDGAVALALTGEDLTFLMDLDDRTGQPRRGSASDQVHEVLGAYAKYGVQASVEASPKPDADHKDVKIPAQKGTDYQHVVALAAPIGFVFHLEPGETPGSSTARWGRPVRPDQVQPALTLGMGSHTNVESLSFTVVPHQGTEYHITTRQQDGQIRSETVTPSRQLAAPLARTPLRPARTRRVERHSHEPPERVQAAIAALAALDPGGVHGQGQLDPARYRGLLRPNARVAVRGAPDPYNGLYLVTQVSTQLSRAALRQSFSLQREGLYPISPTVAL